MSEFVYAFSVNGVIPVIHIVSEQGEPLASHLGDEFPTQHNGIEVRVVDKDDSQMMAAILDWNTSHPVEEIVTYSIEDMAAIRASYAENISDHHEEVQIIDAILEWVESGEGAE